VDDKNNVLNIILIFSFFLSIQSNAQEMQYLDHQKENESQLEFPGIKLSSISKKQISLYGIKLGTNDFHILQKLSVGEELSVSSYVIAEEILNSSKFNSLSYKTTKEKVVTILNSGNSKTVTDLIISLAEKGRTFESAKELNLLTKEIEKRKTDDDPNTTTYFRSGMIEVLPPSGKGEVRYFIPFEDIQNIEIDATKAKIKILKSLSLLGFKNAKQNINYGSLADEMTTTLEENENILRSECLGECHLEKEFKIGNLVNDIIRITTFDFFASSNFDFSALNQGAILQQACLMQIVNEVCPGPQLSTAIQRIVEVKSIQSYLTNEKLTFKGYCTKLASGVIF
jgi:hypothetical protein